MVSGKSFTTEGFLLLSRLLLTSYTVVRNMRRRNIEEVDEIEVANSDTNGNQQIDQDSTTTDDSRHSDEDGKKYFSLLPNYFAEIT